MEHGKKKNMSATIESLSVSVDLVVEMGSGESEPSTEVQMAMYDAQIGKSLWSGKFDPRKIN